MRLERWSTAIVFGTNGAVYGSVFPRLPEVVDRYDLTPSTLGTVLFVPVVLSFIGSALGGRLVVRFGARRTTQVTVALLGASLGAMTVSTSLAVLLLAFAALGLADGSMDVAMNMHAVDLENRMGRSIMQGLHAAWSGGALLAAVAAGLVAGRVSLFVHLAIAGAIVAAVGIVLSTAWERIRTPVPTGSGGTWMHLGVLAGVAVAVSIVESVPIDWSSIFAEGLFDVSASAAASATTIALAGMFVGRLTGDRVTDRIGPARTLLLFLAIALVGAGTAATARTYAMAVFGLGLAGLGSSVAFPSLVSIAGRVADDGIAAVTASSRLGFMFAPIITGAIAESFGFRWIMVLPAGMALAVAAWAARSRQVSGSARPSA